MNVKEFYEKYAAQLRFFLQRQLREKQKAEDVLHDIFESLLRYPPLQPVVKADDYLWSVAWRHVNARNRRASENRERLAKVTSFAGDWACALSSTLSPPDMDEWLALEEQVKRALEKLTPEERRALMLHRLGVPYKDIATGMNISTDSVRTLLRRSYLKLKISAADPEEQE